MALVKAVDLVNDINKCNWHKPMLCHIHYDTGIDRTSHSCIQYFLHARIEDYNNWTTYCSMVCSYRLRFPQYELIWMLKDIVALNPEEYPIL